MNWESELLHVGDKRSDWGGAINPPVVHASLFCFDSLQQLQDWRDGKIKHYFYARAGHPTSRVLEEKIAFLEMAEDAVAFASGMAAITSTLLALLKAGDHTLVIDHAYSRGFYDRVLTKWGIEVEHFTSEEAADLSGRIKPNTRLIYLESPVSIVFDIQDLRAAARVAKEHGVLTAIDNSWATPVYQNPIELGIDLVIHSGSKYIGGHSDLVLGLVAGSADLVHEVRRMGGSLGGMLSADDAYLAIRSLRTLPIRMERHQASALRIARWLEGRPEVSEVRYPGLESFPGHALAESQMRGYSGLFSFRLQPHDRAAQHRFVDSLLDLFQLACSWGGYESLIIPVMVRPIEGPPADAERGLEDVLYRTSIGLEDPDDLIACLANALIAWAAD